LNSVFGLEKVDQKPYNSSIKPMETMQWDELRFSSGGSALETEKRTWKLIFVVGKVMLILFFKPKGTLCSIGCLQGKLLVDNITPLSLGGISETR
jgi:hypothetical protein